MKTRLYALYFGDDETPMRVIGEALILVTETDAADEGAQSAKWAEDFPGLNESPEADVDKPWIAAAMRKAAKLNMAVGGQTTVVRLRDEVASSFPIDTFMTTEEANQRMLVYQANKVVG